MAQDLNHVLLIGRLTADSEIRFTAGGMAICKFSVAVNDRRKHGEEWVDEASFFNVDLFGKSGETLNQFLVKGKQVAIDGKLHQDRWEKDGQKQSRIGIIANNVQLLGGGQQAHGDSASIPDDSTLPSNSSAGDPGAPPDDILF
jgi:single-strand DNA-binding protein